MSQLELLHLAKSQPPESCSLGSLAGAGLFKTRGHENLKRKADKADTASKAGLKRKADLKQPGNESSTFPQGLFFPPKKCVFS